MKIKSGTYCWLLFIPLIALGKVQSVRANPPTNVPQNPPSTFEFYELPPTGYSPAPLTEKSLEEFNTYRLDTGDSIGVSVLEFSEFSFAGALDGEGNVTVPILGRLSLKGLTLNEAESKIAFELNRRYLKNKPQVNVSLSNPRPVQLTILGEVAKPGFYSLAFGSPLHGVLQTAGGSTKDADLRSIVVRRKLLDGTTIEQKVDLYSRLQEGSSQPNLLLRNGDTVIVSKLEVGNYQDYDRVLVARSNVPKQGITVRILAPASTGTALRTINLPNGSTFLDLLGALPIENPIAINRQEIALMRFDPQRRGIITQTLNAESVFKGDISQNTPLQDEDVIVVSRSLIGNILNTLNIISQPISDFLGFRSFFDAILRGRF